MITGKHFVMYIKHVAKNNIYTHFGKEPKCDSI